MVDFHLLLLGPNNWLVYYEMLHRALDLVVSCKYSNKPSESEDAKLLDKLSTVELFSISIN